MTVKDYIKLLEQMPQDSHMFIVSEGGCALTPVSEPFVVTFGDDTPDVVVGEVEEE